MTISKRKNSGPGFDIEQIIATPLSPIKDEEVNGQSREAGCGPSAHDRHSSLNS